MEMSMKGVRWAIQQGEGFKDNEGDSSGGYQDWVEDS
jgi:hypothetical protein